MDLGVEVIVAHGPAFELGHKGDLPWRCLEDLAWFSRMTQGGIVVGGRITAQSLPHVERPSGPHMDERTSVPHLKGRALIVVSRTASAKPFAKREQIGLPDLGLGINADGDWPQYCPNLSLALGTALWLHHEGPVPWVGARLFVIGGEKIFQQVFEENLVSVVHRVEVRPTVPREIQADTYFDPDWLIPFRRVSVETVTSQAAFLDAQSGTFGPPEEVALVRETLRRAEFSG